MEVLRFLILHTSVYSSLLFCHLFTDNFKVLQITVDKVDNLKQLYQADGKAYMRRDGSVEVLDPSDIQAWCKQQQSLPYYGLSQPALGQSEYGLSQSGLGQSTFSQNSLFLPTTPTPDTYQQLSYQRNQLPTHVPPFGQPQPNTIMVSSATSSLMSTSIKTTKPEYNHAEEYHTKLVIIWAEHKQQFSPLQPFPNQLFGANALLIATQTQQKNASSQLLGSQLVHPRPAVQIVQQVQGNSSFNQQPPQQQMQQTCFFLTAKHIKFPDVSLAVMGNTVPVVEDGKSSNLLAKLDEIKEEFFRLEVENRSLHEIIQSEKQRETEVLNKVIQSKNDDMIRYANKIDEESARKEAIISSLKEEKEKSSADGKKTATGIKKLSGD
ncbi:unnamed protein product [Mytilus edulis]|uniref:Uncharacterized protein n=1 Tax=Mytilus edulis TaxID=6550 RepID=A0A8S3SPU1_MYTED|nr:unnamed protein product [Mytilus edulis]